MKKYAFGVDVGGTTVKIGLFSVDGALESSWEIPTRREDGGTWSLRDIAASLYAECQNRGIEKNEISGIGLGVPGAVLDDRIVNRCVNLGWGVVNVAEEMERLTGVSNIKAANDANVAALGEIWQGGGKGYRNMVMLTLGTGVGGGVILDGKIVSGAFGAGGEIGHFRMSNIRDPTLCR